ncbi:hypothetical protein GL50803_003370 [Giardia duodenalis]|uniref:Uncharacterized protein n=1 Tax=Giardia intestinalis (strain ATCC 50803 / WB clone C6) TaxID=184922 RepID=A8BYH3_GIAIC|nr:uncharacterized protein GL50803_003370 [Giardia intestinalis]KAE8302710.1 hypothetical protein GL50803_003370 [Giardia intestinalis]|eukprot:XP_001704172.1 Hypothetical protein GL50803_3370 [Giardia lamblia ATCC 50803]
MHHLRFYLPLQRVDGGFAFFAPGGVGPVPAELQHYPTVVVSTDPSNENQLIPVDKKGVKLTSQGKKETGRRRRSGKPATDTIEQPVPATGNSDAHSTIDESEDEVYMGDNAKSNRALLEAQAVARRLITLTKEIDGGLVQGEEATGQRNDPKEGLVITEAGAVYLPSTQASAVRACTHTYGPMLSRVLMS